MRRSLVLSLIAVPALPAQDAARHWAFVTPRRAELPAVQRGDWPQNAIDRFVLAKLEERRLAPQPQADRATLLRRLHLDLTGLPPTPEEIDAFVADRSPDAFIDRVERLLGSPRHAEQMARWWLDAARYGDTHGMEADHARTLWPWRDWVIDAFARNVPFDVFTRDQLAGDLVPDATPAQRVATGFHRNNPSTAEGGLIPEEMLVRYAAERAEVTGTVWLGLTVGCARCHDHKYDPITQRDFYALFDFFHSIAEEGSNGNAAAPAPSLAVPPPEVAQELDDLEQKADLLRAARDEVPAGIAAAAAQWDREQSARLQQRWRIVAPSAGSARSGAVLAAQPDGSWLVAGPDPDQDVYTVEGTVAAGPLAALRLEALRTDGGEGPGRAENGNCVWTGISVNLAPADGSRPAVAAVLSAASADFHQRGFPPADVLDGDPSSGWAFAGQRAEHAFVCGLAADAPVDCPLRVVVELRFESPHAQHTLRRFRLAVGGEAPAPRVDASAWEVCGPVAGGPGLLAGVDPPPLPGGPWQRRAELTDDVVHALAATTGATFLRRRLHSPVQTTATVAFGSDDGIAVWCNGERILARDAQRAAAADQEIAPAHLRAGDNELLAVVVNTGGPAGFFCRIAGQAPDGVPAGIAAALAVPGGLRSRTQAAAVLQYLRMRHDPAYASRVQAVAAIERRQRDLLQDVPQTMVMQERAERRPSHLLRRGRYDQPGEPLTAGVPAFLGALPAGGSDRLALARWLCSEHNPLGARVTMNRLWQFVFGRGLVATPDDFGTKGSPPSHPELLDWLACEFVQSGWDLRHMLRLMVGSAVWQQDSDAGAAAFAADPDNVWLSRGSRRRLDAEPIRDQALLIAGLLVERVGGPGVRPYQPEGVWEAVAFPTSNTKDYVQDRGDALYRRSLYTFWKRTAPPPLLTLLDAPSREHCAVLRERTNTPLQALALWNDVGLVEAARAFAARLLRRGGGDEARLAHGFRCCTGRAPGPAESAVLRGLLARSRTEYAGDRAAAAQLCCVGESAAPADLDVTELAAWTVLANLLLNLDATVTRS